VKQTWANASLRIGKFFTLDKLSANWKSSEIAEGLENGEKHMRARVLQLPPSCSSNSLVTSDSLHKVQQTRKQVTEFPINNSHFALPPQLN